MLAPPSKFRPSTYSAPRELSDRVLTVPASLPSKLGTPTQTYRKLEDDNFVGSEVLRSLNFALNPQIHHRRKKNKALKNVAIEQLKSQIADISKANKNLLVMKENKKLGTATTTQQLLSKPKLKQSRSVVRGTISVLMSGSDSSRFPHLKKHGSASGPEFIKIKEMDISAKAREKLRLQMVTWLIEHKKPVVAKINENQQIMISWVVYLNYINRNEFDELLMAIGINYDANLFERLFRLFDLDDNGVIDQKEILATLELFNEHSFEEKIKSKFVPTLFIKVLVFFELVDDDGRGVIDEEKLVRFLRKNLRSEEEIKKVRPAVKALLIKELNLGSRGTLTRDELARACERVEALNAVVEANVTYLKTSAKPKVRINSTNLIASQLQLNHGGFSLPYMQRLVSAFEEKESIAKNVSTWKKESAQSFKRIREISGTG